jgi:hypothetical protein
MKESPDLKTRAIGLLVIGANELLQDVVCVLGPDEWFGVDVVLYDRGPVRGVMIRSPVQKLQDHYKSY